MLDFWKLRSCRQIVFECFDLFFISFGQDFDPSVLQIADVAPNLMAGGGTLGEKPETDTLHESADNKFSSNNHKSKANVQSLNSYV